MADSLHINWTMCDGRGLCAELLPTLLDRDAWGYPLPRFPAQGGGSDVELAPEDMAAAQDAVYLCPRMALSLRTDARIP